MCFSFDGFIIAHRTDIVNTIFKFFYFLLIIFHQHTIKPENNPKTIDLTTKTGYNDHKGRIRFHKTHLIKL